VTDALAAIRAEKAFLKLSAADRERLLASLSEARRSADNEQRYDRYIDRNQRIRNRDALKTHLAPILKILADEVGWFDAMDWLTDYPLGRIDPAERELKAFENTARRFLDGAKAFKPDVGRKGRGEKQLRTELTWQAFHALIEALDDVGVRVGATGGERGGPGTRLLALLIAYAVGFAVGVETVKALVRQRRRRSK
jgi:hypothetical protein